MKGIDQHKFWSLVEVKTADDCWEWRAGRNSKKKGFNYGVFHVQGVGRLAHRIALSLHLGRWLGRSVEVLHTCDNPPCCNPKHLRAGTHLENMRDMNAKGRRVCERGEARYNAKLNESKVRSIRKLYPLFNYTELADRFSVDRALIERVVTRKAWRHVHG